MIKKKVMNALEYRWYFVEGKNSIIIISPQKQILPHFNKFYFVIEQSNKRILSSLNQKLIFDRYEDCYNYIVNNNLLNLIK